MDFQGKSSNSKIVREIYAGGVRRGLAAKRALPESRAAGKAGQEQVEKFQPPQKYGRQENEKIKSNHRQLRDYQIK